MRVIAGESKGHPLKWPKVPHIRPTSERVREAIFSSLETLLVDWSRTVDLYAGTGALGIEALSRGGGNADFVEKNPRCCSLIKDNLRATGLIQRAQVHCLDAVRALAILEGPYNLVLLDPPYEDFSRDKILEEIVNSRLVDEKSVIVMEHSSRWAPETAYGHFQTVRTIRHGDTRVSIFRCTRREN
ncbi:MAG: 16S rRNA (guanine(966)-N(2))-methyltransferase RsmD [Dehalococcoidia bacterium]